MKKINSDEVMIIDDNEIDIFINKKVIEFSEFCSGIICMQTGSEALDYLKNQDTLPGLILLDLNMPVMDGFRFLFEFAQLEEAIRKQIRIVVLTSSDNSRDKEKVGANDDVMEFVSKPLTDDKLDAIREKLTDLRAV